MCAEVTARLWHHRLPAVWARRGVDDGQQRTAMCFLCEHQWEHSSSRYGGWSAFSEWLASLWPQRIRGVSDWRPCPHCGAAIQKEGGCPMM